jgi:polyhydroxybutyrate depolymerase
MMKRVVLVRFLAGALLGAWLVACSDNPSDNASKEPASTSSPSPAAKDGGATRDAGRSSEAGPATQKPASDTPDADDEPEQPADAAVASSTPDAAHDAGGSARDSGSAAPVSCPASVLAPGETTSTVQVGGVARTFILHVPTSYTGKTAVPLVIDWHSLQGTGAGQEGISGYKALSDKEGFMIAWPNGIDGAWNIGPCCTKSSTVDDLGFARAIVEDLKKRACIDPKRVYADGYSMGGGMSHYLACNAADVFAAVAPSAFDLLTDEEEPCHPSRPISVIFFRGTADPLVNYEGGASMPPNGLNVTIHFLGAQNTFKKWAELDGCTDTPHDSGDGCSTYNQCKDGVEVTLCTKQGGSHDPGDAKRGWDTIKKYTLP